MNRTIKIFYLILLFLSTFHFKSIAEPTFVQSKSIETGTQELGLTFNNDGTKMYTLRSGGTTDAVIEYILTSAYDISTATVNNTKVVHRSGDAGNYLPSQVVFNNDGTKMFVVNHHGVKTVDEYLLSTAFDVSTATFDSEHNISGQEKRANSVAFNNDGTRMIVAGAGNMSQHRIHEYSLSIGFELSSTFTHLNT